MKVTRLKVKGKKPSDMELNRLESLLKGAFTKAGYETEVNLAEGKIGMRMQSFRINTSKLKRNERINSYSITKTKTGYIRTSVPTWGQREDFNHIINDCFDKLKASARIISGPFTIRNADTGRVNHWTASTSIGLSGWPNVPSVLEIVPAGYGELAVEWHNVKAPWYVFMEAVRGLSVSNKIKRFK